MDDDAMDDDERPTASRREFIRRGAIALGIGVWAAPVVQMVRGRGHGGSQTVDTGPQAIGVQAVTPACTTCEPTCGSVTLCGSNGIFDCFCAPSAAAYPLANCICASDVFCDEATPCSAGCPEGWACAQGCCAEPVCLPPCPAQAPAAAAQASGAAPEGGGRLTVAGRRL